MTTDDCDRRKTVIAGLEAAIRDMECPVQFSPLLMEARRMLAAPPVQSDEDGREVVAAWMILRGYATGHGDSIQSMLFELEAQAQKIGPNGPLPGKGDIDLAIRDGLNKFDMSMAWEVRSAIADAIHKMVAPPVIAEQREVKS